MVSTEHFYFNIFSDALKMFNWHILRDGETVVPRGAKVLPMCKRNTFTSSNLLTVVDKVVLVISFCEMTMRSFV